MTPLLLGAVALGGLIGAPTRFVVDRTISRRFETSLPWGTIVINVTGSFLLGLLAGLGLHRHLGPTPEALLGSGFCGAYTTFSTFTYETLELVEDGQLLSAAANVGLSLVVGLLAAAAGLAIGLAV